MKEKWGDFVRNCTLCGGKLDSQKRCTLCGLDNTKNDSMYKHMINRNECADEPLTHVHEETEKKRVPHNNTYGIPQYGKNVAPKKVSTPVKKTKKSAPKKSGCLTFIGFIPFIIAIIGFIGNVAGDIFSSMKEPDYFYEEDYEYNPYDWVVDEMPETGDEVYYYLTPGIYEIGHHIPMGTYQIDIASGTWGNIEVYDEWNEIYLSEFLDADSDNTTMEDVMLFDGAYLVVHTCAEVQLSSYNAQAISVAGSISDGSQETIVLDGQLVSGEDFEPGAYNIIYTPKDEEFSYIEVMITPEGRDYGFHMGFDSSMGEESFQYVPLPVGATIEIIRGDLQCVESLYLIPSDITSESDLENFYSAY